MKSVIYPVLLLLLGLGSQAQEKSRSIVRTIEATVSKGKGDIGLGSSFDNNWRVGKSKRLELGFGLRWTFYQGRDKEFVTAPAPLAKGSSGPLVFFKPRLAENLDTLFIDRPKVHLINITANLAYQIVPKLFAGFNIDLVGLSLGKKQEGIYTSEGRSMKVKAKPTTFNFLKVDDNTIGSQNSEFFLLYEFNERWSIKGFYELVYIEYKTDDYVQILNGDGNDRFHDVPKGGGIGISYYFK
ncbi:MAG TPA: hypothetical protein VHK91_09525 [Flavisolibacter sp.]|jgi:hypothetical protein|nr:hypothetical protein [Flavisolibacter sp.]